MTTTPRARAGKPNTPPMALHGAMPIDFVHPDESERTQGCTGNCRQGRDCTCCDASADVAASEFSFWAWTALMWTGCWLGIGYIAGRYFS